MNVQIKVLCREISEYLWRAGLTLSTAESCTAGLVASALTSVPGASTYFRGGVVTYATDLKTQLLGVPEDVLNEHGAVSEPVARAMASGALEHLKSDYAIAVTGYAGPGGGDEAPVGTVWIAVGGKDGMETRQLSGDDGREVNLQRATMTALLMLLEQLRVAYPVESATEA